MYTKEYKYQSTWGLNHEECMSKMIRMSEESSKYLDQLADEMAQSKQDLLALAIQELYKKHFFEKAEKSYERLQKNPAAWAAALAERQLWESTASDGLDKDDEDYDY